MDGVFNSSLKMITYIADKQSATAHGKIIFSRQKQEP